MDVKCKWFRKLFWMQMFLNLIKWKWTKNQKNHPLIESNFEIVIRNFFGVLLFNILLRNVKLFLGMYDKKRVLFHIINFIYKIICTVLYFSGCIFFSIVHGSTHFLKCVSDTKAEMCLFVIWNGSNQTYALVVKLILKLLIFSQVTKQSDEIKNFLCNTYLLYNTISGLHMWSDGTCSCFTPPYSS